jgi:hypothetical protein
LLANDINKQEYNDFIKQDTEGLFTDNLRKATNTITDIGAVANILRQGGDIYSPHNSMNEFSKSHLNSFTKQMKNYKKKHPENKTLKDLEDFSHFIIQYPSKFTMIAKKRAEFYLNVVEHKKLSHSNNIMGRKKAIKGGDFFDEIRGGLEKAGEPFKAITGINPGTAGYDLGHDIIGPALFGRGLHVHHHHYHPVAMAKETMGTGFLDTIKKIGKVVAPAVISEGANKLKDITGNNKIANTIIDKGADMAKEKVEGLGMKKPKVGRFVKGSPDAREYMRKLREMRKK